VGVWLEVAVVNAAGDNLLSHFDVQYGSGALDRCAQGCASERLSRQSGTATLIVTVNAETSLDTEATLTLATGGERGAT